MDFDPCPGVSVVLLFGLLCAIRVSATNGGEFTNNTPLVKVPQSSVNVAASLKVFSPLLLCLGGEVAFICFTL